MADIPLQFPNIGNALAAGAHARYFAQRGNLEAQQEQQKQNALQYVEPAVNGDPVALGKLGANNPQAANAVSAALARMDARTQAKAKAAAEYTTNTTTGLLTAPAADRPRLYQMVLQDAQAKGIDTSRWPQQYDEPWVMQQHGYGIGAKAFFEQQQTNMRHNTPQATNTDTMVPMNAPTGVPVGPPPGGAPAPAPATGPVPVAPQAAAPPINPRALNAPPDLKDQPPAPPVPAGGPGPVPTSAPITAPAASPPVASPPGAQPPQAQPPAGQPPQPQPGQQGAIWTTDPSTQGGVMMGHKTKPGAPVLPVEINGHFLYRLPNGQTVLYKPGADTSRRDISSDYSDPEVQKAIQALPPVMRANFNAAVHAGDHKSAASILAQASGGVPPELFNAHGDDFRKTDYWQSISPIDRNVVEGLLNGSIPSSALSKRGGGGKGGVGGLPVNALYGLAAQIDPTWSPNEGEQRKRFELSLTGNGVNAQNVMAANVVPRHAADLVRITDAMNQNNPQIVNDIILRLKAQFGDTAVPDMIAARNLSALEFLKAAVGPGALNQTLEKEFLSSIPPGATAAQVRQVVNGYVDKVLSRTDALQETAKSYNMGQKGQDLILHPETKKYIDFLKGNRAALDSGSPSPAGSPQGVPAPPPGFKIIQ